jgi:hypothetical protein
LFTSPAGAAPLTNTLDADWIVVLALVKVPLEYVLAELIVRVWHTWQTPLASEFAKEELAGVVAPLALESPVLVARYTFRDAW